MPDPRPFALPDAVIDAATAVLVDLAPANQQQVLARLVARFPEHHDALHALAATLARAEDVLADTFAGTPPPDVEPQFDGYRVVRRLGEGAFGVVYLCDQLGPIPRQVAVKLLRPGAGDRGTLARFDAERRFLARLRHPAIAQIHDAGMLADGRPWFVMEHVAGVPITAWCDGARLPIDARLRLFARLCQGVHYAHEQGVVHRDLKPSNVLVVEVDGEAQPKIIDFGVARALQPPSPLAAAEPRTETGRVVGTPGYMSPEQAAGRLDEVDARTDGFALGVLLFELLTGTLPFGKHPGETDTDAPRPSQRLAADPVLLTRLAERRNSQPKRLAASVRGDLDWIVRKALARERGERYATALELAADVQRHLRGEPVHAGPPSWRYRLRKFVRRHRAATSLLAVGVVVAGVVAWVLVDYRGRAIASGLAAEAAVKSLLARANDPTLVRAPESARLRQTLAEDALAFYDQFLRDRPDDEAALEGRARTLWTLSQVHWLLGQYEPSERVARDAVATAERWLAGAADDTIRLAQLANCQRNLGRAVYSQGRRAEARPYFLRAIELLDRCEGRGVPATRDQLVAALVEAGSTLDPNEATATLERALAVQTEVVATRPEDVAERQDLADVRKAVAIAAAKRGDFARADALLQDAERDVAQGGWASRVSIRASRAALEMSRGDDVAALRAVQELIALAGAWVAAEPSSAHAYEQLGAAMGALPTALERVGRRTDCTAAWRDLAVAVPAWCERFPENPNLTATCGEAARQFATRALTSGLRADVAPAVAPLRTALSLYARGGGNEQRRRHAVWNTLGTMGFVADALDLEDADTIWREAEAALAASRTIEALAPRDVPTAVSFLNAMVRRHLAAGRDLAAGAALAAVDELHAAHEASVPNLAVYAAETHRLHATWAARRGDWTAAELHVEAAANANDGWRGVTAAADGAFAVWRAIQAAAPEQAEPWRERAHEAASRAAEVLATLGRSAGDVWIQVPFARLRIRAAQARPPASATDRKLLERAVELYAATGAVVHAREWDPDVLAAGRALLTQ